jgi:ribosomal protein S11
MYLPVAKARRIQNLLPFLKAHLSYVSIRFSLNNFYIHVRESSGCTLFSVTGGHIKKVASSKRNSTYNFELLLSRIAKELIKIGRPHILLCMDISVFKRKKLILKIFQNQQLPVLGVSVRASKAFNGVRIQKNRRL